MKYFLVLLLLGLVAESGSGFSLRGPRADWMIPVIGYGVFGEDHGPMNLGEEYRWNQPVITYGYDASFVNYFGTKGIQEIEKAIAIMNALPKASKMSRELLEFPLNASRYNFTASAQRLLDVKSGALAAIVEQIGLTSAERYVWTLRGRAANQVATNYLVIQRSFDPVTLRHSPYINQVLYSYRIQVPENAVPVSPWTDAFEFLVDPLNRNKPVASVSGNQGNVFDLDRGEFFTGLTRDDVGGIRYLLVNDNRNVENLLPNTTAGRGGPYDPSTGTDDTNFVNTALRPGVEKLTFKRMKQDSRVGGFVPITNVFKDKYFTNGAQRVQTGRRAIQIPDLIFAAGDTGLAQGPIANVMLSTTVDNWENNSELNTSAGGQGSLFGPGVIRPPLVVTFSTIGPQYQNTAFFVNEQDATPSFQWASFDGSTNAPIIYPQVDYNY